MLYGQESGMTEAGGEGGVLVLHGMMESAPYHTAMFARSATVTIRGQLARAGDRRRKAAERASGPVGSSLVSEPSKQNQKRL